MSRSRILLIALWSVAGACSDAASSPARPAPTFAVSADFEAARLGIEDAARRLAPALSGPAPDRERLAAALANANRALAAHDASAFAAALNATDSAIAALVADDSAAESSADLAALSLVLAPARQLLSTQH